MSWRFKLSWWLYVVGTGIAVFTPAVGLFVSLKPAVILLICFGGGFLALIGFIISPRKTIDLIRSLFSQKQSIKVLPSSLGGNDTLSLDNLAIMKLHVPFSLENVTLILDVVPTRLPDWQSGGTALEGVQYYDHSLGTQYFFDKGRNKRHEITIGNRTFVVSLQKIIKLDVKNVAVAMEYQFGISEKIIE